MKGLFLALRGLGTWVVPVSALLFAFYIWNVGYGMFRGSPEDTGSTWFVNATIVVLFLVVQGIFSSFKGKISVGLFLMDLGVSSVGALISGYALFQETFTGAQQLSTYQEQLMLVFFLATLGDTIMGAANDGHRMILTDEAKIIS
jgi:hypothetical protein